MENNPFPSDMLWVLLFQVTYIGIVCLGLYPHTPVIGVNRGRPAGPWIGVVVWLMLAVGLVILTPEGVGVVAQQRVLALLLFSSYIATVLLISQTEGATKSAITPVLFTLVPIAIFFKAPWPLAVTTLFLIAGFVLFDAWQKEIRPHNGALITTLASLILTTLVGIVTSSDTPPDRTRCSDSDLVPPGERGTILFVHTKTYIREGPELASEKADSLNRGDSVSVGVLVQGWREIWRNGVPAGFIRSDLLFDSLPVPRDSALAQGVYYRASPDGRRLGLHTGCVWTEGDSSLWVPVYLRRDALRSDGVMRRDVLQSESVACTT